MLTEYKGIQMQQNVHMGPIFQKFLNKERFHTIIEIGTRHGGLTRFIKDTSPYSRVLTFDVENQVKMSKADFSDIEIRIKNIFSDGYNEIIDEEVLNLLNTNEKRLILCDGGNKIAEFNCFSQYLRIGDIIMAHDYARSLQYFDTNIKGKIWNWCEIMESDIFDCSTKHNLVHYYQQEMENAVWVCKIKVA